MAERFDIVAARKRLGLTQEQMANALNVTTRTLQNWESDLGTSQMPKKTQDFRELLALMDDYVIAPKEREWLETPLPVVQNRRPMDLIAGGKLRDLIVEFQGLREGQPVRVSTAMNSTRLRLGYPPPRRSGYRIFRVKL
jgi:transcriptional regulator with XRE-family HTH domain